MSFCPVPELKYNKAALAEFAPSRDSELWQRTYNHDSILIYRFTSDQCEEVRNICKKIVAARDIIDHLELFLTGPRLTLPAHIDNGRKVALNIPVKGDFTTTGLDLYSTDVASTHDVNGATGFKGQADHVATVNCTVPYLVDTSVPHGTSNPTDAPRIILSITFNKEYSFTDIFTLYKQGKFIVQ